MKSRKIIRFTAVILAVILALIPSFASFAAAKEIEYNVTCPTVKVHGFMSGSIYKNLGTDEQEEIFPMPSMLIPNLIKDCIPALTSFLITKDWDKLGETVTPIARSYFEDIMLDNNGDPQQNSGIIFEYPSPEEIKSDSVVEFEYDWRLDPLVCAAELDEFIDYVRECSGCDKVALVGFSLGGVITATYLSVYGYEKIHGVLFNTTAVYGETYTGELLSGQITLSTDSVNEYLRFALDQTEYEQVINGLIDVLTAAGIYDLLLPLADEILLNLSDYLIPGVIAPIFGGWLSIWAMVPDEYLDSAMSYVFDDLYKDSGVDYSKLIEKIENYNELVRKDKTRTIIDAEKNCRFGVFTRYGYSSILATPSWQNLSDGTIDTKYSSFGATTAKYGETFSDEYLANVDAKYISPGKNIDASTCLFPEKTWFIKYLKHSDNYRNLDELRKAIFFADEPVTVDTYEDYPRYMINDCDAEIIRPETDNDNFPVYSQSTFIKIVTRLINFVYRFLKGILKF